MRVEVFTVDGRSARGVVYAGESGDDLVTAMGSADRREDGWGHAYLVLDDPQDGVTLVNEDHVVRWTKAPRQPGEEVHW